MTETVLRRFGVADLPAIRKALLDVYAEVYAADLDNPFNTVERYDERLTGHARDSTWEVVLAYAAGEPIGYAYGSALMPDSRWWAHQVEPLTAEFVRETGHRTLAFRELMLHQRWRGHGLGRRLHDELLTGRPEQRVTLLCREHNRPMYQSWGYEPLGHQQPFPDSPRFTTMLRPLPSNTA